MEPEEFQKLLDEHYKWPTEYMFKFIVKSDLLDEIQKLEALFDELELIEKSTRSSHGGKYTSYSVRAQMPSSAAVIEVYEKVYAIGGVVSL
jgi:putative lipoic acid-binding regulatory protein